MSRRKNILKASKVPTGAVPKMMTSKQMKVMSPEGDKVAAYLTYAGNMANIDYSQCDSLVPIEAPAE